MAKFFRVAVEGATATDGRKIERQMLLDAVTNFNRDTYQPRINMEHIRGLSADGPFKAYGDVTALKTEEVDITLAGKTERRLALFAALDPTDDLKAIVKKRQKQFTSCEFAPNFGGSTLWGLPGIAVTDNPASLGTEMLQFSGAKAMFDARKSSPESIFSAAEEVDLEFDDDAPADPSAGAFASFKTFFDGLTAKFAATPDGNKPVEPAPAAPEPANDNTAFSELLQGMSKLSEAVTTASTATSARVDKIANDFAALKTQIEQTESSNFSRSLATGGDGEAVTDC